MHDALKSLGNAIQLAKVVEGTLQGEEAATALRQALAEIHAAEETIEHWRRLVSNAEMRLIYGAAGRPARKYPPSFGPALTPAAGVDAKYGSYGMPVSAERPSRVVPDFTTREAENLLAGQAAHRSA